MWQHKSKILTPISNMTSKQAKRNWCGECQKVFDTVKNGLNRKFALISKLL